MNADPLTLVDIWDPDIGQARPSLAWWAVERAGDRKREFGFGYRSALAAARSFEALAQFGRAS